MRVTSPCEPGLVENVARIQAGATSNFPDFERCVCSLSLISGDPDIPVNINTVRHLFSFGKICLNCLKVFTIKQPNCVFFKKDVRVMFDLDLSICNISVIDRAHPKLHNNRLSTRPYACLRTRRCKQWL